MSESLAGLYVEMTYAFNEAKVKPRDGRTPENPTPTRFEDFAGELAQAYKAKLKGRIPYDQAKRLAR